MCPARNPPTSFGSEHPVRFVGSSLESSHACTIDSPHQRVSTFNYELGSSKSDLELQEELVLANGECMRYVDMSICRYVSYHRTLDEAKWQAFKVVPVCTIHKT